jgi:hypothetical protein
MMLALHVGMFLGCVTTAIPVVEDSSEVLLEKVSAIWTRGGSPEELAAIRKEIEQRATTANDSDHALSCARLHATPANIEKEKNYYAFLLRLSSAAGMRLVCDPTAKECLELQTDPPVVRVGSMLQALAIIEKYSSMQRLRLLFGRRPDRIEITFIK